MATHLQVLVKFLGQRYSGRKQPPDLRGYRPHFIVPPSEEMLGVEFIDGPSNDEPNEELGAIVKCLFEPDVLYDVLIVGTNFEIVEGSTVVGGNAADAEAVGWPHSQSIATQKLTHDYWH